MILLNTKMLKLYFKLMFVNLIIGYIKEDQFDTIMTLEIIYVCLCHLNLCLPSPTTSLLHPTHLHGYERGD